MKNKKEIITPSELVAIIHAQANRQVLAWINQHPDPIVAVCVLTGGMYYFADLTRLVYPATLEVGHMSCSHYGSGTKASGCVKTSDIKTPNGVKERRVLLIDEIWETGSTLLSAKEILENMGAREVKTCALIAREEAESQPDFSACTMNRKYWLYGYGMDAGGGFGRNLPSVWGFEPEKKS